MSALTKSTATVTAAELAPEVKALQATVEKTRAALVKAGATAEAKTRDELISAFNTFQKAVEQWGTTLLREVVAGAYPLWRWRAYRDDLVKQAEAMRSDFESATSWWSKALNWATSKVATLTDGLDKKVRELRARYKQIGEMRKRVQEARTTLRGKRLSPVAQGVLFGEPAANADAAWARLVSVMGALEQGLGLVTSGKATLAATGKDFKIEGLSPSSSQALGAVPVIAGGTVIAIVAVAGALTASLWAYYSHADEVTRSELHRLELELMASGKVGSADVLKLRKLRTESDKAREEGGVASAASRIAKAVAVAGTVVALGAAAKVGFDAYQAHKRGSRRRKGARA